MSLCTKVLHTLYRHRQSFALVVSSGFQKSYRNVHHSSTLHIKMFMEYENSHAYNIMESKGYVVNHFAERLLSGSSTPSKEQFNAIMNENWNCKTPTQIFELFSLLASYSSENKMCISDQIFDSFVDHLTDTIKLASDQELQTLFYSLLKWPETPSVRTRNYIEVWAALDDECLNRLKNWFFDEMLSFMALFYMLNVTKVSDFSLKVLQKLASKSKHLTSGQLVQTMFYIGIHRKAPFDMHNLELHLEKLFPEFTLDELAIMSMGFFKSKTPIRNTVLIENIIHKVMENSKEVHEVSLAALLKVIRYSLKVSNNNIIYSMLDKLQHEVPRLSVMCNVHLALVGMSTLTFHKECLERIAEATLLSISNTRIKDLERLVLTFGTFNLIPSTKENYFDCIIKELKRPERDAEIKKHGRSFTCCIAYLGTLEIYPVDLMNKVLSEEFLIHTYGKHVMNFGREVLVIHNTAKLFCPKAMINLLSDKDAIILAKKYTDFMPDDEFKKQYNIGEKIILDVMRNLKNSRGGEEFVVGGHILTHHQRGDVIVCDDANGSPVQVREHFSNSQFGLMRNPPDSNDWVALVIAGRNALIHNSDVPTGPFKTKLRELEALGYSANLVSISKYNLLETNEAKTDYLNNLIKDANNKKKYVNGNTIKCK